MMSLSQIRQLSQEAAAKAQRASRKPFQVWSEDLNDIAVLRRIPFTGDYTHPEWRSTGNVYFVDSSGFGEEREPALTPSQFLAKLRVGFGYAIIEAGQFQVYIAEFVPKKEAQ